VILGTVIGELWGARRHPLLGGRKLLVVRPRAWYAPAHDTGNLVAVDVVGAGVGEEVVVCLGDGARRTLGGANLPVDAAVLGIVDRMDREGTGDVPAARVPGERP
jgi:ethanolamine utilization protein EutN